ncbi:hypothetical protein H696_01037 [Fonticula alba]|uniref:Nudix hydrolase domain-containing protein n=1 Tax=Fonticula alba TaxID=691883 RepID=A0A058ZB19_FONAL|nr:hypothetical protein, variant [Fonticula alba]XP_009493199.1 hypothetical protein H696_01037 [Fonticula alba]KCV71620.1 hypothetical protein H696_01037 [Fonticula alba]KCV71621.1 hypothetical protein, variant [Fonticula alba]|eukprot:XP_009493198.1 hypothetical protein, variant [Fonticula alba]
MPHSSLSDPPLTCHNPGQGRASPLAADGSGYLSHSSARSPAESSSAVLALFAGGPAAPAAAPSPSITPSGANPKRPKNKKPKANQRPPKGMAGPGSGGSQYASAQAGRRAAPSKFLFADEAHCDLAGDDIQGLATLALSSTWEVNQFDFFYSQDMLVSNMTRHMYTLPSSEFVDLNRLGFSIEQASWDYFDFMPENLQMFDYLVSPKRSILKPATPEAWQSTNHRADVLYHNPEKRVVEFMKTNRSFETILELISHYDPVLLQLHLATQNLFSLILNFHRTYRFRIFCAGLFVFDHTLKYVLMVESYNSSCWALPRGKLNEGENIVHCSVREGEEELGIDLFDIAVHSSYLDISQVPTMTSGAPAIASGPGSHSPSSGGGAGGTSTGASVGAPAGSAASSGGAGGGSSSSSSSSALHKMNTRYYFVSGLPESVCLAQMTRKEIRRILWFDFDNIANSDRTNERISFYTNMQAIFKAAVPYVERARMRLQQLAMLEHTAPLTAEVAFDASKPRHDIDLSAPAVAPIHSSGVLWTDSAMPPFTSEEFRSLVLHNAASQPAPRPPLGSPLDLDVGVASPSMPGAGSTDALSPLGAGSSLGSSSSLSLLAGTTCGRAGGGYSPLLGSTSSFDGAGSSGLSTFSWKYIRKMNSEQRIFIDSLRDEMNRLLPPP